MNCDQDLPSELMSVKINIDPFESSYPEPSKIFAVTGTNGNDDGLRRLIRLMANKGQFFYYSDKGKEKSGPNGLIENEDIVIIKVNSQWDERGGTNTDLVKSLIETILDHPERWRGEVIVADNGQAQYGGSGRGGSLDWDKNNAENQSQSIQNVVDEFRDDKVSTYLWDIITSNVVQEFAEGDLEDGYVVHTNVIDRTGTIVSYPKFTTPYGTQISFKLGVYKPELEDYETNKLKVINLPVLKTHMIYGVTGAVKNYMGVPSDKLTSSLGYRIHNAVDLGAMGTLMANTRVPNLNLLDAIYVNSKPKAGPKTPYSMATKTNIIAMSIDPTAMDYWASKNILCKLCEETQQPTSSMDPDNTTKGEFGDWLKLSMYELNKAGYNFNMNPEKISVYIDRLD